MLGSGRGGSNIIIMHAWHCGWLYSGCLAAQSMILVAPSTILLIPFQFSLIYLSTIKVQHNHKYFIWTICLKSINNVLDLHIKMSQLEKIMKPFHLPLVRRWKAVTLLRVHFSKQSDSVWNSTQLPRNQLRNQQPDIFSSKLIFLLGLSEEKRFSPLGKDISQLR